jgi:hypothetical protein
MLSAFALAFAAPASGLSRAMWAEFNAIYLINLKPAAECREFRIRSIEILKDASLSPPVLDERMHALWNEAKPGCLAKPAPEQPSVRQPPGPAVAQPRSPVAGVTAATPAPSGGAAQALEAAPAPVPAKPAVGRPPAPTPSAVPPPSANPATAPPSAPVPASAPAATSPAGKAPPPAEAVRAASEPAIAAPHDPATATGGRGNAAPGLPMQSTPGTKLPGEGRPLIALPQLRPAIDRPPMVDLRLEAACAKRNPYAYQVETGDDPCARLAQPKAAKSEPAATGAASPASRTSPWLWPAVGVALAALGGAGGGWLWRRRRSRTVATPTDAEHDGAGDTHAGQRPRPADEDGPPGSSHHDESLAPALS